MRRIPITSGLALEAFLPGSTGRTPEGSVGPRRGRLFYRHHLVHDAERHGANGQQKLLWSTAVPPSGGDEPYPRAVVVDCRGRVRTLSHPGRKRCLIGNADAAFAGHQRDGVGKRCPRFAMSVAAAFHWTAWCGISIIAASWSSLIRRASSRQTPEPASRGRLDLLHPWVDASDCRGVPSRHPHEWAGVRCLERHRRGNTKTSASRIIQRWYR